MNKLIILINKHWFEIGVFLIVILAVFLRFYNYGDRWGLAYDQARDVIVASEALHANKIPLIGPFSSAGQFVYGPQWLWVLMLMIGVYPNFILTPWIIQSLLYVVMVVLLISLGKEISGRFFGLIVGLLSAVSTAQITQSTNLTSPSMVSVFSILSLYFLIKYVKNGNKWYIFLMYFSIGTAINIHLQAIGLLFLVPVSLLLGKRNFKIIIFSLFSIMITFVPLVIFDLSNNFFESRNVLDYYLHGQYRIYVANRWLTYAGVFWPNVWKKIIGGELSIAYLLITTLSIFTIYGFFKRTITKEFFAVLLGFLLAFVMLRYYRGERFDSYFVFLHSFVLIFSGWTIFQVFKLNRILGISLLCIVFVFSIKTSIQEIKSATNYASVRSEIWKNLLKNTYPGEKFAVYDYGYSSTSFSFPFVLFLYKGGMLSDNGHKIGIGSKPEVIVQDHPEIKGNKAGFILRDLNSSSSGQLSKDGWSFINPSEIYRGMEEWYFKKKH